MYVGEVHTAKVEDALLIHRQCGCGEKLRAHIRVEGVGVAEAAFFIRREEASLRAERRARDDAKSSAEWMARIARCPRCSRRERGRLGIAAIYDGARLFLAITIALGMALAIFVTLISSSTTMIPVAFGIAFVVATWRAILKAKQTLRDEEAVADRSVLWLFCVQCDKRIAAKNIWSMCERCNRPVHDKCAVDHATSHVPTPAYR